MIRKAGRLSGVISPILWTLAIVLCGSPRPGYSHATQYISELGERGSTTESLMRYGGFVPTGLMHVAFATSVRSVSPDPLAAVGAALLALNGVARVGAGVFPCAPGCAGPRVRLSEKLHSVSAVTGFGAFIGAALAWAIAARRTPALRALAPCSLIAAGVAIAALTAMSLDSGRAAIGLYERIASGALSLWVLVFAVRVRRLGDAP